MNLPNNKLLLAIAISGLAGCVSVSSQYGSGPIQLSSSVKQNLDRYKSAAAPEFFAVSIDGNSYGYSTCREFGICRNFQTLIDVAIYRCQNRSKGVSYKIYARGKQVVWKYTGPGQNSVDKPPAPPSFLGVKNNNVCDVAILGSRPAWDTRYPHYIAEAKARQLTEINCAMLTGRFSEEKIARTRLDSTFSTAHIKPEIKKISNTGLCMTAIKGSVPKWDPRFYPHILEAKLRGLPLAQCARLTGRFSQSQIAASKDDLVMTLSDRQICQTAIRPGVPEWDPRFPEFCSEAQSRGLTECQCAALKGRFG